MEQEDDEHFSDWEDDDDDDLSVKSLFDNKVFKSINEMVIYDFESFGFDLRGLIKCLGPNDTKIIQVVNYIRSQTERMKQLSDSVNLIFTFLDGLRTKGFDSSVFSDPSNMKPVLEADPLLFSLREYVFGDMDSEDEIEENKPTKVDISSVEALQSQLAQYKNLVSTMISDSTESTKPDDSYYFEGYSHIGIHETMLRDFPRTNSYASAFRENAAYFKDKIVLDVGCGTGILSMCAARAGAKKVFAIDRSNIVEKTRKIIERNGLNHIIEIIQAQVEDHQLDDAIRSYSGGNLNSVDVIVSEWMGYGLYFENMFASVIDARNRYLAPQGILMPSHGQIFMQAMTCVSNGNGKDVEQIDRCNRLKNGDRIGFWNNVYGFDMSDMIDLLIDEAQVELINKSNIISNRALVHELDYKLTLNEDLDFQVPFVMVGPIAFIRLLFPISFLLSHNEYAL